MRKSGLFLAALVIALASPASAQPTNLQAEPGKDWKHKATGVNLPPQLAGLDRDNVSAFGGPETDVGANYWSADRSYNVTVFLYRNVSANAPLWFDRARSLILLVPQKYPNPQSLGIRAFTPKGQATATGLMEVFTTESKFRSTGVIVFPVSGFYAKIRASSTARDAASLEQLMLSAANAIDWTSRQQERAATPVEDCRAALPARRPAKPAKISSDDLMMSALIGGVVAQAGALKEGPNTITYCREPGARQISYGIYRANASSEGYVMALLDAGRAIVVGSSDLSQIMSELKRGPRVSVTHVDMEKTATYGDFASLPLPNQAVEMVERTAPLSVASTWGDKNREITINTGQ